MRVFAVAVVCVVLASAGRAHAQEPATKSEADVGPAPTHEFSLGQMTPTPEMWFYDQALRNYRDPKTSVRRRAEFEADQRQARLAAQRWFGYSVSRPTVSPTPFTGNYSPSWTSNSPYPGQWRGINRTTIIVPSQAARSNAGYGLW